MYVKTHFVFIVVRGKLQKHILVFTAQARDVHAEKPFDNKNVTG